MALEQEQKDKFKIIGELISKELMYKLSSLVNRSLTITYNGSIDTCINNQKFTVRRDSFLVTAPIKDSSFGSINLVASNQQVFVIADLVMGGAGTSDEAVKPDETNQMVFAETINQVFRSLVDRLKKLDEELNFDLGDHEYRQLQAIKEQSLVVPDTVENPCGLEFKIKIAAKLDSVFIVEVNQNLIEHLTTKLFEKLLQIDIQALESEIKQEYLGNLQEEKEEDSANQSNIDPSQDSGYKVDEKRNLGFLKDINLDLIVELGRADMTFKQVMRLTKGSSIELDKACDEAVDLYVHNQLVARGEIIAIDDCFGLKITEVIKNALKK